MASFSRECVFCRSRACAADVARDMLQFDRVSEVSPVTADFINLNLISITMEDHICPSLGRT